MFFVEQAAFICHNASINHLFTVERFDKRQNVLERIERPIAVKHIYAVWKAFHLVYVLGRFNCGTIF